MPIKSTERMLRRCMLKLIRQKKLENITVNEICEMAEIGKRTFYRYYADKYALFEDTYIKEFYEKLEVAEDQNVYDIYGRMAEQIYEEQDFFLHAITSKGQNGFWELVSNLIFPLSSNVLTSDPYIDREKEFYIRKDIEIVLHHFEKWIFGGFKKTPEELVEYIRMCNAIHGKWQYQVSTGRTPDEYTLEKFKNNEW